MSDQQPSRQPPDSAPRKSDSQLRLVRGDEEVVIPDNVEPTDDSPTIISKHPQASEAGIAVHTPEMPSGKNLRGQRLAHFELLEPIGVGGMAAVLRARDLQLDRFVALKILPPEMATDPENVRRFHQEARAAAKLDHENIARVFFCGEDKGLHFIAFEFVEGENLRTLIERRGLFPVPEAIRYILQIATGLDHAAARGVVHRDIKPSNIIISPNGRAKLVDMGLARSLEPRGDQDLTQSGVTLGTFDYISPEQALDPREADIRSDVYSLGCTLYHMLTGQPPVPEGNAFKKMKHHQDVAPIDPRQLNPQIPDEVAAILMRMMAKQPKDRYQKPVQLITHLYQVAQKIGAGAEAPESVLFLDAPLPGAPRMRPVLTISLAMLALGVLLLLISLAPPAKHTSQPIAKAPRGDDPAQPKEIISKPPAANPFARPTPVSTRADLQAIFEDSKRGDGPVPLDSLIQLGETGLVYQGDKRPKLVLESVVAKDAAKIAFQYQPSANETVAGLTIDGGNVEFRNIRFEVQLQAGSTPRIPVALVAVRGGAKVRFVGCRFLQKDIEFSPFIQNRKDRVPLASIRLENPTGEATEMPDVAFEECYFEQGQAAVAVHGPAKVQATSCAFGPHGSLFHLQEESKDFATDLKLRRCSAFVVQGPAFRLDGHHTCSLQVHNSIFSCPENGSEGDEIQLIRQTDSKDPLVRYLGLRNIYHGLSAFWVLPGVDGFEKIKANLDDFKELVAANRGKDEDSIVMTTSPWKAAEPLALLTRNPQQAFQVRPEIREVRLDETHPLGLEAGPWGPMAALPKLPAMSAVAPNQVTLKKNEKIIDPDAGENTPGVYQSIAKALPYTVAGDVLLLKEGKTSRDLEVRSPPLEDPNCSLTLRPYPGQRPVLVLPEDTRQKDAALFKLVDGKLQFENLEFVLEPEQPEFKAQSIVALAGNGVVSFKNCVITLRQPERRIPLSAVTFLDPGEVMKMSMMSNRLQAQVHVQGCVVRGEGDLVKVRGSRPFELKIDNSVLALAGSALHVQAEDKDAPSDNPIQVRMTHVSAFLTEPLLNLHAGGKSPRSLGRTVCEPVQENLFVMLAEKPLVALDNVEANEETFRSFLDWKGEKNAYVKVDRALDRVLESYRPGEAFPATSLDSDAWRRVEADARFSRALFAMPPLALRDLSNMQPEQFQPKQEFREELLPYGANLDPRLLPRYTVPRRQEVQPLSYE